MANQTKHSGINVGGASILVIFVLLCLTTFATLSLVSANADRKLTDRTVQAAAQYYEADLHAQELLAQIDAILLDSRQEAADDSGYFALCRERLAAFPQLTVSEEAQSLRLLYQQPLNDRQALEVELKVLPHGASQRYERVRWQLIQTGEWVPDESLDVWDGTLPG